MAVIFRCSQSAQERTWGRYCGSVETLPKRRKSRYCSRAAAVGMGSLYLLGNASDSRIGAVAEAALPEGSVAMNFWQLQMFHDLSTLEETGSSSGVTLAKFFMRSAGGGPSDCVT